MKYICGSSFPTHPTLNINLLLEVKMSKNRHFFRQCLCTMFKQNKIIFLPTYPKRFWHEIGTTYIFHFGLRGMGFFSQNSGAQPKISGPW